MLPNVGLPEMLLFFLVLLLLFGPNRLVGIGAALGRTVRDFRREVRKIEDEVRDDLQEIEKTLDTDEASRPAS